MWKPSFALLPITLLVKGTAQQPSIAPNATQIAAACFNYEFPHVVCVKNYGSNIQGHFERRVKNVIGDSDTYPSTSMSEDTGFYHVANASFLVWDRTVGEKILGPAPVLDFMFRLEDCNHEAPVYSYATGELYLSRLQNSYLPQLVVDLKVDPPTLSERLANPPIYAGTGSRYRNGTIYYATSGGNDSIGSRLYYPGLYALNVTTGESSTLANSYYGYYFNGLDDLDIDEDGRIWFTDNCDAI